MQKYQPVLQKLQRKAKQTHSSHLLNMCHVVPSSKKYDTAIDICSVIATFIIQLWMGCRGENAANDGGGCDIRYPALKLKIQ